ncbi:MAG TPA: tetratricopeptide repeat protein [Thermodesulfobacteriota bacterium]
MLGDLTRDELYLLGTEAFERGDLERAEALLERFLETGAPYADVLNRVGLAAHRRGAFGKALTCFGRALELNPRYNEAALNLAVTLMDLGRYDEAERVYRRAEPGGPAAAGEPASALDPFVRGKLANRQADLAGTYHALGLLDQAIEGFHAALALCPTYPDIRLRLGVALRDAGRFDEALREFSRVEEEAPHLPMAGVQKGITRYAAGDVEGAVAEWRAVLAKHPRHPRAEMYLRLVRARRLAG